MAIVDATGDVPDSATDTLREDCSAFLDIKGRETTRLLSADPPSYLKLIADLVEWTSVFKLAAGAFFTALSAQLGKEVGADLWKNKAAIARSLAETAARPLRLLAEALRRTKDASPSSTYVAVVLCTTDQEVEATMVLPVDADEKTALALAIFINQVGAIEAAIREEIEAGRGFTMDVRVTPQPDGSALLTWTDRASNEARRRLLPHRLG